MMSENSGQSSPDEFQSAQTEELRAKADVNRAQAKSFDAQTKKLVLDMSVDPLGIKYYTEAAKVGVDAISRFGEFGWKIYDTPKLRAHELSKTEMTFSHTERMESLRHSNLLKQEEYKWVIACIKEEKLTQEMYQRRIDEIKAKAIEKTSNYEVEEQIEQLRQIRGSYPLEDPEVSILHEYMIEFQRLEVPEEVSDNSDQSKSKPRKYISKYPTLRPLVLIAPPQISEEDECEHPVIRSFRDYTNSMGINHDKYRFLNVWKSGKFRGDKHTKALWYAFRYVPTLIFETQEDKQYIYIYSVTWDAGTFHNRQLLSKLSKGDNEDDLFQRLGCMLAVLLETFLNMYYLRNNGDKPSLTKYANGELLKFLEIYYLVMYSFYFAMIPHIKQNDKAVKFLTELIDLSSIDLSLSENSSVKDAYNGMLINIFDPKEKNRQIAVANCVEEWIKSPELEIIFSQNNDRLKDSTFFDDVKTLHKETLNKNRK